MWKYIAGGGTVLGYQAFYERMTSKKKNAEFNQTINNMNDKLDLLYDNMDKSNKDKNEILEIKKYFNEVKSSIKDLSDVQNKYWKIYNENTDSCNENPKKLFESYEEEFGKVFNKAKEISDNLDKKYNNFEGSINKLSDDNYIIKLINQFNDYLSNLSITEICLVINISSCIFILTCLVTILFAVYGNILIDKLNLEEKYPKLASFIKLRIKLQHTYVFINTLLILIALVLMVIINFITLING